MDPSVPLLNGRNMLEELPNEVLINIFGYAICIELNECDSRPVITSKPLTCFAHIKKKPSDAGLSIASKHSLAWQSPKAASCYLEALQQYVKNEQVTVYANIADLNFTNFKKFLTPLEKNQANLQLFSVGNNACSIKFSHCTTRLLKLDPPTFNQYCKKTKKLPVTLNTSHKINSVEDRQALGCFVAERNGITLDHTFPGTTQFEQIFYQFHRYAFRESVNPLANKPWMENHEKALAAVKRLENRNFQNTREGWNRANPDWVGYVED
ncbi:hypothetical protein HII31_09850 [Pseudocercospora fuligena]|uniref:Uncharacterized protein n=1 Tax=Pseudocercospora fuligena TaxID=685502 RepID=A0A8H6RE27_9PEZI|nr:hypothetical protein HII31_09850 [Pseudocercospora fuligena]